MEKLRSSRYFVLAMLSFVIVLLVLMGVNALQLAASVTGGLTGTPEQTGSVTAVTAVAEAISPTLTPRPATATLTPTPPPLTATPDLTAEPPPVETTPPGSGAYPPPVVTTPPTGGYPPPAFTPPATLPGYPGPTTAATATSGSPGPTDTLTPTPTSGPTAASGSPTATSGAPPTATQQLFLPCNLGEFVQHISYPPDSPVYPNEAFRKTWQVRNGGTCTWNTSYDLIFQRGEQMDAKRRVPLAASVAPNSFSNLSIDFLAPLQTGTARGFWLLQSGDGEQFGMGVSRDQPLEVHVRVLAPDPDIDYDLANAACTAIWLGRSGVLPCQGDPTSPSGSIVLLEAPVLEGDRTEDQTTLWTRPGTLTGASISAYYPDYVVQTGDHFRADVGCLQGSELCDVLFSVGYLDANGREHVLESYEEDYDGQITRIDIDLSTLAGQEIRLILRTRAFGQQADGNGFWLAPGIQNLP